jgi:hypothetical protein
MTRTSSTSFRSKASGHSACQANAGLWAAGGAASFGKNKPVRLLFAWALARTRKRWVFEASSRASPNILFKRTR